MFQRQRCFFYNIFVVISLQVVITTPNVNAAQADSNVVQMEEVTVEGHKTLSFDSSPIIAVIGKSEIESLPVSSMQELLEYVQGIDLRTRGIEGIQSDVSIRGGTFDQAIVLLNGINVTDPQTGHLSLNIPLDINAIERIEVLQGIDTWLAGVPTFCGAINIITKKATKTTLSPYLDYGMYDFLKAGIIAQGATPALSSTAIVNYTKSSGYTKNTDFNILNAYISVDYDNDKLGNFELQTGYLTKEFGANSFYSILYKEQFETNKSLLASLKYNNYFEGFGADDKINLNISTYYRRHYDKFELFRWYYPEWYTGHNFHKTDIWGANTALDYKWKLGTTSLGVNFRSESISSSTLGDALDEAIAVSNEDNAFYTKSKLRIYENAYLKHFLKGKSWNLQIGTMLSGTGTPGDNNLGFRLISGGNFQYILNPSSNLLFTLQQGYRLPTFTDLFYDGPQQKGSPGLKPEESINSEISYQLIEPRYSLQSKVFYRYGYRVIDWIYSLEDATWYSQNLTNVATFGVDVAAEYKLDFVINKIKLNYSYLDVKKHVTDDFISLYATDFLRHQLNIGIGHAIYNNISANWQFRFLSRAGAYVDENNNIIDYPSYLLCDLKIVWKTKYFDLYLEGTNLFDSDYLDIGNLPQPGIWLKTGIKANLDI